MEIGSYGWKKNIDLIHHGLMVADGLYVTRPAVATSAYGDLNVGSSPFDGQSAGTFAGSPSGTKLAINAMPGFAGNLADWQVNGACQFRVTAGGAINAYAGFVPANGQLLIGNTTNGNFSLATLTQGANVTITNAAGGITIAAAGSVSSVAMTVPSPLTVSGSPITGSGTLALTWTAGQTANQVLATPDGTTGAVGLRALVAADIPNLSATKITTGALATARGGTGLDASAAANGSLLIGNGTGLSLATLTQGANITITNAAGSITIASTGGASSPTSHVFDYMMFS